MSTYTGRIELKKQVNTFAVLGIANRRLLERARQMPRADSPDMMATLLFSAFTFEAALNHIGAKIISSWNESERLPWRKKLKAILHHLKLKPDFAIRPYKSLEALFEFRDAMAHGRDNEASLIYEVTNLDISKGFKTPAHLLAKVSSARERYCTIINAELAYADSREIIEIMYKATRLPTTPFNMTKMWSSTFIDNFPNRSANVEVKKQR